MAIGTAAALIGGSLIGGAATAIGSSKQAGAVEDASQRSAETIEKQYAATKETLDPYIKGGLPSFIQQQALSGSLGPEAQSEAYGSYVESPGVAWAREQGLRGINQNASAGGALGSGNRQKALIDYSQGSAEQDFSNYYNRLGSITGVGLSAASALGGVGQNAAAGQAQAIMQGGQAAGAGYAGMANAAGGAVSDLSSIYALNNQGLLGGNQAASTQYTVGGQASPSALLGGL